jgi:arabinofuranosyltransferase
MLGPSPPLLSGSAYGQRIPPSRHGIADERAYYYPHTGFLVGRQDQTLRQYKRVQWGLQWRNASASQAQGAGYYLASIDAIGYASYYAGPKVHVLDPYGLGEPLLARMPMEQGFAWRIGHVRRAIPEGLAQSLISGDNHIADPALASYYERLMKVTRGKLFSVDRLVQYCRYFLTLEVFINQQVT